MKQFKISKAVREKLLEKHNVTVDEVYECFYNREGPAFTDTRLDPQTDPPTQWFVAETDKLKKLKIVYCDYGEFFAIKSAFEATNKWQETYTELCAVNSA